MLSMLKAQGLDLNNEDRLDISRRQRRKDLQLQLKWSRGRELETADFPPIQHYYRKLSGERLQTAEMAGSRRWKVKCSFSIKLKRPDKCKTGLKEIEKQRKMKLQQYLYAKKVCATLEGKETLNKSYSMKHKHNYTCNSDTSCRTWALWHRRSFVVNPGSDCGQCMRCMWDNS